MEAGKQEGLKWDGRLLLRVVGESAGYTVLQLLVERLAGFRTEMLFRSRLSVTRDRGMDTGWLLLTPDVVSGLKMTERNPWEVAHTVRRNALEFIGPRIGKVKSVYVEPNLFHSIYWPRTTKAAPLAVWPSGPDFAWHREKAYTDLRGAGPQPAKSAQATVRIGILDTGIPKPPHEALPLYTEDHLGWNFAENTPDVSDPGTGLNPGHGTATIGLLAGNKGGIRHDGNPYGDFTGGSPLSPVVPVRVASTVVVFMTVELARGIDHIGYLGQTRKAPCEVLSISMGGLAAESWADAVNHAYDQGVCIVAAAGNNIDKLPTRYTVYPSRFHRVLTVTGVTADHEPYISAWPVMQGNYGPTSVMKKAIGAYTPKMMHGLLYPNPDFWDETFEGTSAATPQVAAAAALWLARYGSRYPEPWRRIEAVRAALFCSADKSHRRFVEFFGNGTLRAASALDPSTLDCVDKQKLQEQPRDRVSFPFLRILLGWDEPDRVRTTISMDEQQMLEVEAINLVLTSEDSELQAVIGEPEDLQEIDNRRELSERLLRLLATSPEASKDLRRVARTE